MKKTRTFKTMVATILALVMTFAMAVCASAGEDKTADERPLKIGVAFGSWTTNPVMIDIGNRLRAECKEKGHQLFEATINTADDVPKICENFIASGCDIVIIHAYYPDPVRAMLPQMLDAGIAVGIYDEVFEEATYSVSCDNYNAGYEVGKTAAEWANENIDGEVYAGTLQLTTYEFLKIRGQGMTDGLNENLKNGKEVIALDADSVEKSLESVENMLQAYPDLNLVCAVYGTPGVGAYEGLKAAGLNDREDVGLFSCDASQDELTCILEGKTFKATLDLNLQQEVINLYKKLCDYVYAGGEYPEDMTENYWYYPMTMVWKENAEDYIIK